MKRRGLGPSDAVFSPHALQKSQKSKGLTLDRAVRLLRSALAETTLTVEVAIALMDYHEERNKVAKASHDKAWHTRHEGVKYLLL